MDKALELFGDGLAIAFSGAEDVALIQYAKLTGRPFRVFSLDTGRLNPETYQLFDDVEKHFDVKIEFTFPDEDAVTKLVNDKGMFSFYEDGHKECCGVRKVQPLRRKLGTLNAWVTGQRKDQSPGTRMAVPAVQVDPVFEGASGGAGSLIKFNPLTNATSQEVWDFLRVMGTPVNKLHEMGYVSIGCAPCTRAVLPGQQEREGRWWWEDSAMKECGLHSGNLTDEQRATQDAREATEEDIFEAVARRGPRRDRRPANGRGSLQDDPRGALRAVVPVLPSHGGRVRGSRGWVQVQGRGRHQVPRGQRREGVEQGQFGAHVVPDRAAVPERKGRVRETRIGAKGPGVAEHLRRIHRRQALMWETRTRV